jgi:hypothetical protein
VLWYTGLPVWGYPDRNTDAGGYVMEDARRRDQAAWELAHSDRSPLAAFGRGYLTADQYGGLLFLSAVVYRSLGGASHHPLQMVAVTAAVSALAVLFTWGFARRAWGDEVAKLAAWGVALYPEAILMGSSQMREGYTVALVMAAVYGLLCFHQERSWVGAAWTGAAIALCLPFSPPMALLLVGVVVVLALAASEWRWLRRPRFWLALGGLAVLAVAGVLLFWNQITPLGAATPLDMVQKWVELIIRLQAEMTERASGWIQRVLSLLPVWAQMPFIVAYGVVRPLLPAALVAASPYLWWGIAIWRALGWTILLAGLLYATLRSLSPQHRNGFLLGLGLVVWLEILVASLRGGGDMWDNPRYRATFAGLQVAWAAWVWVKGRPPNDPFPERILASVVILVAWFVPWYFHRYGILVWPVSDLFKTLGLGLLSVGLYWVWDWFSRCPPLPEEEA